MPKELLVIVPTRGRPENAERLIGAFAETGAFEDAQLVFACDEDDPKAKAYERLACDEAYVLWVARWVPMVHKLNAAANALVHAASPWPYVAFMGDDHIPRTYGWARTYIAELTRLGTGIVFGDDLVKGAELPTQWAMTANIVRELGRMVPADVEHLYCDNSILALGRGAGCIKYLPDVKIEHAHPCAGRGAWDKSYAKSNSREQYRKDHQAYMTWLSAEMPGQVEQIKALMFRQKIRTVGTISARTKDVVVDGRRPSGERCKITTDELGNSVTESANRQDVLIRAPRIEVKQAIKEVRPS